MKTTMRLLALGILLAVTGWQNTMPAHVVNSTPTFDVTGIWKSNAGDTMEVFQEKDEVNAILVSNAGFAHRLAGRYVSLTKIRMIMIRRTRPNVCEMTMDVNITVNSANALSLVSVAAETACGLTSGQSFPNTFTRI